MKTTLNIKDATLVVGVPQQLAENASASGRLIKGEAYRIIGYAKMAGSATILQGWTGVAIERIATGTQLVVGVNTLLGKSIVFVGVGAAGASTKGYKIMEVSGNCFTSVNDFQAPSEDEDNNTIFVVKDTPSLKANVNIKPSGYEPVESDGDTYVKTKDKQFYVCQISKKESA